MMEHDQWKEDWYKMMYERSLEIDGAVEYSAVLLQKYEQQVALREKKEKESEE